MLLIIPALDISGGNCSQTVRDLDSGYATRDPVEMAILWRKENAKTLHVTDRDGIKNRRLINVEAVTKMVAAVDIPIELGGGIDTVEEVRNAFDCGVYRVIVSTALIEDQQEAKYLLDSFGPSKIAVGIGAGDPETSIIASGLLAKQRGFKRIIYGDLLLEENTDGTVLFSHAKSLAENTGMRVTVSGGVTNLEELLKLQEMEPLGVDSVIIGQALYENKFACQGLWRFCEAGDFPFTAKV